MVSRTRALAAAAVVVVLVALSACGSGQEAGPGSGAKKDKGDKVHLSMFIWAGSHQGDVPRKVAKEYMAAHPNVKIDFVESNNTIVYPKMVAAKRTTPNDNYVDFGFFNAAAISQGVVDNLWQPIDPKGVPNMSHVLKQYVLPNNMGVGYQTTLIGMLYNKKKLKSPPTSWTDLWNPKYKQAITQFDYDWTSLVLAARLNGGSETNIDPGFKQWTKGAKQLKALVTSNDQLQSLMTSGQAQIAPWYVAIAHLWQQDGAPLGFAIPKEGAVAFPIYLSLVSNLSPNQKKVAQDIINLLLSPENAGKYGELTYETPVIDNAALTEAQKKDPNLSLDAARKAMQFDWGEIAKQDSTWRQRWEREVKSRMG